MLLLCFIYVSDSTLILFVWILSLAVGVGIFYSRKEYVTVRAGLTCDKDKRYTTLSETNEPTVDSTWVRVRRNEW